MTAEGPTADQKIDEALEETFPASDPPGNTVETGIDIAVPSETPELKVRDNRQAHRFEAVVDKQIAFMEYERRPDAFVLVHTEVPASLQGKGVASQLVKAGLQLARAEGKPIRVLCPFVRDYLRKHPGS